MNENTTSFPSAGRATEIRESGDLEGATETKLSPVPRRAAKVSPTERRGKFFNQFNLVAIIAVLVYNCNGAGATCGG